jgi:hypothetical protein
MYKFPSHLDQKHQQFLMLTKSQNVNMNHILMLTKSQNVNMRA